MCKLLKYVLINNKEIILFVLVKLFHLISRSIKQINKLLKIKKFV